MGTTLAVLKIREKESSSNTSSTTRTLYKVNRQHRCYDFVSPLAQLLSAQAVSAGDLGFDSRAGQIANGSSCEVPSKLRWPGAKSRR